MHDRRSAAIVQLALGLGSILHPAALRKTPRQHFDQLGKLLIIAATPALRLTTETGNSLRHVSLEADPLLFSIITNVDTGLRLLFNNVLHRSVHLVRESLLVDFFSLFAANQKVRQHFVTRQTSDMGHEKPIPADLHVIPRS